MPVAENSDNNGIAEGSEGAQPAVSNSMPPEDIRNVPTTSTHVEEHVDSQKATESTSSGSKPIFADILEAFIKSMTVAENSDNNGIAEGSEGAQPAVSNSVPSEDIRNVPTTSTHVEEHVDSQTATESTSSGSNQNKTIDTTSLIGLIDTYLKAIKEKYQSILVAETEAATSNSVPPEGIQNVPNTTHQKEPVNAVASTSTANVATTSNTSTSAPLSKSLMSTVIRRLIESSEDLKNMLHDLSNSPTDNSSVSINVSNLNYSTFEGRNICNSTKLPKPNRTLNEGQTFLVLDIVKQVGGEDVSKKFNDSGLLNLSVSSTGKRKIIFEATRDSGLESSGVSTSGENRPKKRQREEIMEGEGVVERKQRVPKRIKCDPPENGRNYKFMCQICKEIFSEWRKWKNHDMYKHNPKKYPDVSRLLACSEPDCGYVCDQRRKLNKHAFTHSNVRPTPR